MNNNQALLNNSSSRLLAIKQSLDNTLTCEFSQSLVIKNKQDQILCMINYAEDNDIYVMTLKDNVYVFTSDDIHKLNKFVRFADEVNDCVTKVLASVNVLNLPSTSIVNLDSCTASVNANGLSILVVFNFWSLEQIINSQVLVITENKSKGKSASNIDINECAKYLESQVAPTFFVPNNRVRRVRIRGKDEYLSNQANVVKTHIFDDTLNYANDEPECKRPSQQWIREKDNAIRAFDREITTKSCTPDDILNKCLNGSFSEGSVTSTYQQNNTNNYHQTNTNDYRQTNTNNYRQTNTNNCRQTNDYVNDDYVYNPADFEDYPTNYDNFDYNKSNTDIDITKNIRELNFFEKEVLMNLHSINLSELKRVYNNHFSERVKVILDYFDAFTDEAIDSIREILKSCGVQI